MEPDEPDLAEQVLPGRAAYALPAHRQARRASGALACPVRRHRSGAPDGGQSVLTLYARPSAPPALVMDPLCMLLRHPARLFLGGLHLLASTEHEARDDYQDEERDQAESYAQLALAPGREARGC